MLLHFSKVLPLKSSLQNGEQTHQHSRNIHINNQISAVCPTYINNNLLLVNYETKKKDVALGEFYELLNC